MASVLYDLLRVLQKHLKWDLDYGIFSKWKYRLFSDIIIGKHCDALFILN